MKKVLLVFAIFCLFSGSIKAGNTGYKWGLAKTDSVLCELLNIPIGDPFFTTTIRQDYLKLGVVRVSSIVGICPFRDYVAMGPNIDKIQISGFPNVVKMLGVIRDIDTDSAYSLIEIDPRDVGQKEIATSSPARYYWWEYAISTDETELYIYPPTTVAGDSAKVTVLGLRSTDDFTKIRQTAHDKIILYAFYKCYLQRGEIDIADKFGKLIDVLLFDQKNILENRPIDITIKKKVLSK